MEDEPTAPSRLNAKVPRDLQTICLKCLQFEPQQRYGTPSELADDLRRFLHGEPVAARRAGLIERAARWGRRRPLEAAVIGGGVLVALALLIGGVRLNMNRERIRRTVRDELREVARHEAMGEWADARVLLARAKGHLETAGSGALTQQAGQAQIDLDLVARLASVLLERAAVVERDFDGQANKVRADQAYALAFQKAGYGSVGDAPGSVGKVISGSAVHDALVGALDDWAVCAPAGGRRNWVLATARSADNDKGRARLRDPAVWEDRNALSDVTRTAMDCGASVQLLDSLGEQLYRIGGDPIPFLKQVQQAHPENYWANSILADALRRQHSPEAVGYFQAAVAVEPSAAAAYNNLGIALRENGRLQDAGSAFAAALRINPNFAPAHNNLGIVLRERGETDAAIRHFRAALAGAPNDPGTYNNLGIALASQHYSEEAVEQFRKSLKLNPGDKLVHNNLGISLRDLTRPSEAVEQLEAALRIDPHYRDAHVNIGIAYSMLRRFDQAIAHFRAALEQDENDCPNHNNLGLALAAKGELRAAIREYQRAIAIDPDFAPVRANLAHALNSSGESDAAIEQLKQASRINPRDTIVRDELAHAVAEKRAKSEKPR